MACVLLVDDDAFFRKMVGQALTAHGHVLVEAGNGIDGLEKLSETAPDLVITDIIMAGKEGPNFIRDIREQGHSMPIIAISGGGLYQKINYFEMAESLGANVSLEKPLNANHLLATINRLVKDKSRTSPDD